MAKLTKLIFLLTAVLLFNRCANQLGPGGGDVDTIPPQILEIYPKAGTTNYTEDFFEITFSEWVDKRSVQDAIFISPPIENGLDFSWSGKSLSVNFKDSLKKNTTYIVTIGAEILDINNRNKMVEPVNFSFSTGAKIDSGKISGKIYSDDPSGIMVYAFSKKDSIVNPGKQKPDFVSQVGKNGKFMLHGLGNGEYNIFAFRDKFRDFLYQRNDDEFGVQMRDLILSDSISTVENTNFFLTIEDTLAPSLSNLYMRDKNHLLLEFNEPLDTTKITVSNFYMYDSTSAKKINPKYFYKGDARSNQFYLSFPDSLIPDNRNFLFAEGLLDKSENRSRQQSNYITVKNDKDTTAPKILKIGGTMPADKVDYDSPVISVKFDEGFDQSVLKNSLSIIDGKNELYPFEIIKNDDSWFNVSLTKKLKPRTDYTLKLDLNNIADAAGNKTDSLYKYKFTTVNDLDFSGVSGSIDNKDSTNDFVVLQSADKEKKIYKEKVDSKKNFNIQKVLPGKYLLWSFKDKNNSGVYDIGKVMPLKYSEEFMFYPDTLNLRARWPVGDIKIDFK